MTKVLLVEDDEFFRIALKDVLQKNKMEVTEAPDGKTARSLLSLKDYDLIVSDIQMPHLNGIELLTWVKEKKQTPVILMTGFSNILETQAAASMGASGFLAKPFSESELIKTIQGCIKASSNAATHDKEEDNYCKIFIDDFVVGNQIPFNIYILLGGNKYIKIAHKGEDIPIQKIKMYKEKNVRYLYIKVDDFGALVGMNMKLARSMGSNSKIPVEVKKNFAKYTGELILEKAFVTGVNEESFHVAKEFVQNSLFCLSQDENAFVTLKVLNEHSDFVYAHSLGVSTYAVLMAKRLGWTSMQTIFKISIGGLFHDIGKKEIERSILEKPRNLLTQQERKLVETHTIRGKEILETIRTMPTEVVHVALEHHENILGMGYPKGLKKDKTHPFARLINVADTFCNYAIKNPSSDGMTGKEAIERMTLNDTPNLDPEYLSALISLFNN